MGRSGVEITIGALMSTVAVVAVALAATDVKSAPLVGIIIVAGSACYLAYNRYAEAISLRRASGLATSRSRKAVILMASVSVATMVIGLSDFAFLTGCYGFIRVGKNTFATTCHDNLWASPIAVAMGVAIGVALALPVASCLRTMVWIPNGPGLWQTLLRLISWWLVGLSIAIGVVLFMLYI
jgi:hypothetical protein